MILKKSYFYLIIITISFSCAKTKNAEFIVNEAIKNAGVERLENAEADFLFRNVSYQYSVNKDSYTYSRIQYDFDGNVLKDILSNTDFNRFINDSLVDLSEEKKNAFSSSINSVIYFAFLPLKLKDEAVNKEFINVVDIKGKKYFKLKIFFNAEGGGEDFEDIFFYYFDVEGYLLDYLAYSYEENGEVGMRFREAINRRTVNGVVVQDYLNFKPKKEFTLDLVDIEQAFLDGKLELLSKIELEDVKISLLKD